MISLLTSCHVYGQIRYLRNSSVSGEKGSTHAYVASYSDSVATDSIYQVLAKDGDPLYYFRNIRTSVCFDNKCRILKCIIYWDITGRYLGFELPKGEYLSKAKHKAFKKGEYKRLDGLLADPLLPLANISYEELAPPPKTNVNDVDAVSSATSKNLIDYIVPGAAYTTYKMWHVVNGSTRKEIEGLTEKKLTADLILKILESNDPADRMWALNHIRGIVVLSADLRNKLINLIQNDNYNLAERAIHSLDSKELESDTLQIQLSNKLKESNYSIRKLIIAKFKEAPSLNELTVENLREILSTKNPELIRNVLEVFSKNKIIDSNTCSIIASLLFTSNNFIAQNAYQYLKHAAIKDAEILELIKKYENEK